MDVSRLRKGEKIAAIGGIALLVVMFVKWFEVKASALNLAQSLGSFNAWDSFTFIDIVLFVTALVAIGLAVLTATQRRVNLPVAASAITAALGILAVVLVAYRIIDPPGLELQSFFGADIDVARKLGVFLGLIAAATVAYGGWLSMQEEGTTFTEAREQLAGAVSGGEPTTAPTPPPPPPAAPTEPVPPAPPPAEVPPASIPPIEPPSGGTPSREEPPASA